MASGIKVIVVEDDPFLLKFLQKTLELNGHEVLSFENPGRILEHISLDWPGIVVSDVVMPEMDGVTLLRKIMAIDPDLPVVLISGHADVSIAVEAMRIGAYDFREKPFTAAVLLDVVKRATEKRKLVMENRDLRRKVGSPSSLEDFLVGKSEAMEKVRQMVIQVADYNTDVLIYGETGTGKELVAHALHNKSRRQKGNFVALNCCAVPEEILESELFGHEEGAFTGAAQRRIGKFEFANEGTIFLDEIDSMPLHLQTKLLRVLQDKKVEPLGSNKLIPLDIRVVASTKIDLKKASEEGRFRGDLYYRLNVIEIELPPLRERREDIAFLFQYFVIQFCSQHQKPAPVITPELLNKITTQPWPGNVRELSNAAERFVLGYTGETFDLINFPEEATGKSEKKGKILGEQVSEFEKAIIRHELEANKGDIGGTQSALGLPRKTLYDKMQKYGLKRKDFLEAKTPS